MSNTKFIDKETRKIMFEKDLNKLMKKHNAQFYESVIFVELSAAYDENGKVLKEHCIFGI